MVEPNMKISGMDKWVATPAYEDYADYHQEHVYGKGKADKPLSRVVERARYVIKHGENSKHYEKVTGYLARAKGSYDKWGAGSRKFKGVAKNVCALRCWGYDPYGTYIE